MGLTKIFDTCQLSEMLEKAAGYKHFSIDRLERASFGDPPKMPFMNPFVNAIEKIFKDTSLLSNYGGAKGDRSVRNNILSFFQSNYSPFKVSGIDAFSLKNIMLTNGTTGALNNLFYGLIANYYQNRTDQRKPGIIIPSPNYGVIPSMVNHLANILHNFGAEIEIVKLELSAALNWKIDADQLRKVIKTCADNQICPIALVSVNPHNPTGAVYTRQDLRPLVNVLKEQKNIVVIDDFVYGDSIYDESIIPSVFSEFQELQGRTALVFGASKSFSLPNIRAGGIIGAEDIIDKAKVANFFNSNNADIVSQLVMEEVFTSKKEKWVKREAYLKKMKAFLKYQNEFTIALYDGLENANSIFRHRIIQDYAAIKQIAYSQAEKNLMFGIDGANLIARPEAGYFNILSLESKHKYFGEHKVDNSYDVTVGLFLASGFKEHPIYFDTVERMFLESDKTYVRINFAFEIAVIIKFSENIQFFLDMLTDEPNWKNELAMGLKSTMGQNFLKEQAGLVATDNTFY